ARAAFAAPVPKEVADRFPEKKPGTWEQMFGAGPATEERFMAWHFARYTETVARAGKAAYPLPMLTNAALNRPGNALFIPEARNEPEAAVHALYAIGRGALGFSPFSIENAGEAAAAAVKGSYDVLADLAPLIAGGSKRHV